MIRRRRPESRKLLAAAAALACCLDLCFGTASVHAADFALRDDLDREVVFSRPPQRIISLMPSLTETVCALGACERLVATDQFSNWPPQVNALPKAGGLDDPGIESIVNLKPDLVLISSSQRITNRLHELGIVSFALSTQRYADIDHTVSVIGEILGIPGRAMALNETIKNAVREVSERAASKRYATRPSVYFEVDRAPYAAGPTSFIGELLALLGARNIVSADLGPFPQLNPEYVVRRDPDVIFTSPVEATHLAERPGWNQVRAVKEGRLCYFTPAIRDTIVRPGPRVAEGMRAIADCLARVAPAAQVGPASRVAPATRVWPMSVLRPAVVELGTRHDLGSPARLGTWLACCLALTFLLAFSSLVIGTSSIETSLGWLFSADAQSSVVLWQIRLPRTVGAWFAGALLGLAGAIAQGVFRNPLADPYLLGTASGAALGVTLSLIAADASVGGLAWAGKLGLTGAAFVGACGATLLTITLSRGVLQTASLLLAGIVIAFLLSAVTSLLLLTKPEVWRAMQIFLLGSTGFISWSSVLLLGGVFCVCIVPATLLSRGLDALTLGEDTAQSLGLSLPMLRLTLLGVISLATATAVGEVGVVGFVGLVAPHLVRETLSVNHRQLLIGAPLCGGALLQAADLVSRWIIRPAELPVGAVTACVGGLYLVLLLWRRSRRDG